MHVRRRARGLGARLVAVAGASCADGRQSLLAAVAPNARALAVADCDESVVVWDLASGRRQTLPSRAGPIRALAFSRQGDTMAVVDGVGARLLDVASGRCLARTSAGRDDVVRVAVAPDGGMLAFGCYDGTIVLRHPSDAVPRPPIRAHTAPITSLEFAPDGAVLASASHNEGEARLWGVADRRLLAMSAGHGSVQTLAFAPSGRILAVAGFAGRVRVWDTAGPGRREAVLLPDGPVTALAFSPDGTTLACGGMESIRVYSVGDIAERPDPVHGRRVPAAAPREDFSPEARRPCAGPPGPARGARPPWPGWSARPG